MSILQPRCCLRQSTLTRLLLVPAQSLQQRGFVCRFRCLGSWLRTSGGGRQRRSWSYWKGFPTLLVFLSANDITDNCLSLLDTLKEGTDNERGRETRGQCRTSLEGRPPLVVMRRMLKSAKWIHDEPKCQIRLSDQQLDRLSACQVPFQVV